MNDYNIRVLNLVVEIIQTVGIGTLVLIIMAMYKENFNLAIKTAEKVEQVKETLKVSSSTLAQEKTLKTLEGKTIVVDNLTNKVTDKEK